MTEQDKPNAMQQRFVQKSAVTVKDQVLLSKMLAKTLRHGALNQGIPIRSDGFVLLKDLVR